VLDPTRLVWLTLPVTASLAAALALGTANRAADEGYLTRGSVAHRLLAGTAVTIALLGTTLVYVALWGEG
jgi:hypothetical protein